MRCRRCWTGWSGRATRRWPSPRMWTSSPGRQTEETFASPSNARAAERVAEHAELHRHRRRRPPACSGRTTSPRPPAPAATEPTARPDTTKNNAVDKTTRDHDHPGRRHQTPDRLRGREQERRRRAGPGHAAGPGLLRGRASIPPAATWSRWTRCRSTPPARRMPRRRWTRPRRTRMPNARRIRCRPSSLPAAILLLVALALFFYARRNRRQSREPVDLGERTGSDAGCWTPATTAPARCLPPLPPAPLPVERLPEPPSDLDGQRAKIGVAGGPQPGEDRRVPA